jgi:hypothetical protein
MSNQHAGKVTSLHGDTCCANYQNNGPGGFALRYAGSNRHNCNHKRRRHQDSDFETLRQERANRQADY